MLVFRYVQRRQNGACFLLLLARSLLTQSSVDLYKFRSTNSTSSRLIQFISVQTFAGSTENARLIAMERNQFYFTCVGL